MPRELSHSRSRSPSYRRRHSPSPRYSRRSRRDRSRSPFSHSRRKSRSISPRRRKARSPTPRRHKSRSPTPRRHKRQRSGSLSLSPTHKSLSPSLGSVEQKNASEKLRKEEEDKKRRQLEAELKLIDEETARRVEEAIRKKVAESLNSEEIKLEIQRRLDEGRRRLQDEVAAQLEKEKEEALIEARRKEEQARREIEELEKMLEENQRRVEESQRKEAEEQQRREEERYRELERIQREKEEAMHRKKQQEEEERLNQMKLLVRDVTVILGSHRASLSCPSHGLVRSPSVLLPVPDLFVMAGRLGDLDYGPYPTRFGPTWNSKRSYEVRPESEVEAGAARADCDGAASAAPRFEACRAGSSLGTARCGSISRRNHLGQKKNETSMAAV
ncbi:hypothetical protein LWI29_023898 [Acer saccharum]|uniref:Uncharacterized protein n=1 Tax=Acer saccharum TaxID=4024 RepID=A0AA39VTM6_ACESA|nr:hypothetical protein LWI29_023898 [Acer saccharum]